MMFNGELIRNATSAERGSFLWDIANGNMKQAQQIDYLFKAALARSPNANERTIAQKLYHARAAGQIGNGRNRVNAAAANVAALQDIWWAVLNSNEFIMNH